MKLSDKTCFLSFHSIARLGRAVLANLTQKFKNFFIKYMNARILHLFQYNCLNFIYMQLVNIYCKKKTGMHRCDANIVCFFQWEDAYAIPFFYMPFPIDVQHDLE